MNNEKIIDSQYLLKQVHSNKNVNEVYLNRNVDISTTKEEDSYIAEEIIQYCSSPKRGLVSIKSTSNIKGTITPVPTEKNRIINTVTMNVEMIKKEIELSDLDTKKNRSSTFYLKEEKRDNYKNNIMSKSHQGINKNNYIKKCKSVFKDKKNEIENLNFKSNKKRSNNNIELTKELIKKKLSKNKKKKKIRKSIEKSEEKEKENESHKRRLSYNAENKKTKKKKKANKSKKKNEDFNNKKDEKYKDKNDEASNIIILGFSSSDNNESNDSDKNNNNKSFNQSNISNEIEERNKKENNEEKYNEDEDSFFKSRQKTNIIKNLTLSLKIYDLENETINNIYGFFKDFISNKDNCIKVILANFIDIGIIDILKTNLSNKNYEIIHSILDVCLLMMKQCDELTFGKGNVIKLYLEKKGFNEILTLIIGADFGNINCSEIAKNIQDNFFVKQ